MAGGRLATRIRIVETAKHYLLEQGPEAQKWLGKDTVYPPAFAGYKAFRLLLREAPQFVTTLPVDVWKRWAPIILAFPTASVNGGTSVTQQLVKLAYQAAPDEVYHDLTGTDRPGESNERPLFADGSG